MDEIWKDIEGYEGLYQVSNWGRVKSTNFYRRSKEPKILINILKSIGYYVVSLHKSGKQKQAFVHKLVAEAFISNPENKPVVDHINTIATDNRMENLRWATVSENVNNSISRRKRRESLIKKYGGKLGVEANKHRAVLQYSMSGDFIKEWGSMSDAWRNYCIDSSGITRACQGKQKTAGGFIWRYK